MKTLREFQQQFSDNILSKDINDQFLQHLNANNEIKKCFSVYRNNTLHSLCEALGDTYPIIKRLVGEAVFKHMAIDFVRQHPPTQPDLSCYGELFSVFLKSHALNNTLAYLPDVALLEWCYQRAFHSLDQPTLNLTALQSVTTEQLQHIRLIPLQSVHLFSSVFAIDVIWEENLKQEVGTVDLDKQTPCQLLIYRLAFDVKVISLNENTFKFLQHLCQNETLADACQNAAIPIDELSAQLAYLLSLQIFTHHTLDSGTS